MERAVLADIHIVADKDPGSGGSTDPKSKASIINDKPHEFWFAVQDHKSLTTKGKTAVRVEGMEEQNGNAKFWQKRSDKKCEKNKA